MTAITTSGSCVHGINMMALCGQCPLGYKIISFRADGSTIAVNKHRDLEHSLATAFVKWTKEREPAERGRLWAAMHGMAKELEKL